MIFMPYEIFMPIEEYKDSKYPGGAKYFVSNLGNIKNYKGKILKQRKQNAGYMIVTLFKDGKHKTYLVHRLVILAFKANPRNCSDVNHIDENKENNSLNNLEWTTHRENVNYGTGIERATATNKANGTYEKLSIPVYCITNNTVYKSACEAARQLSLNQGSITKCCNGKRKSTGGYQFKYYTEGDVQ